MAKKNVAGTIPHIFRSLEPAILISMAYIDLGKWVAAVEGGARFGFELVLLLLVFNCIAVLCQYLSAGVGMVTGKNLAEVCSEEYSRQSCILLGVLTELSMIISDLTMVLGIAYGLTLQFGIDLFSCIFVATLGALLLPLLPTLLDNHKSKAVYVSLAGFALLFYVVGVLVSQPEVPVITNELFPKLTGENVYSVMSLLGANIMAHNFYIHSSIVQRQHKLSNAAMGDLFQDQFFAILIIFTGIFLVNYVLISSAAAVFGNANVVFNVQDVSVVMEQIFRNPVAPLAFLLLLFFSCQITALTRNIGGKLILQHFFGTKLSVVVHLMLAKGFTASLALYCARTGGAEGMYQSLILCQIMLGMLLPASAIPLFRVSSSRVIMGVFKTSWVTETMALLAFILMLIANVIFILEVLFGNSSWTVNLKEGSGTTTIIMYSFLLLGFTSICFTFYLATTPLKSANNIQNEQIGTRNFQKDLPEFDVIQESNQEMIRYDSDRFPEEETCFDKTLDSQSDKSATEYTPDESHVAVDSDHDSQQSNYSSSVAVYTRSPSDHPEVLTSIEGEKHSDARYKDSLGYLPGEGKFQQLEIEKPVAVDAAPETDVHRDKDIGEGNAPESEDFRKCSFPQSIYEDTTPVKGASKDGNSNGNLSKVSGLGRACRRQLAVILNEFWANLFDFHGNLTQEACSKRLGVLLGFDMRTVGFSGKAESRDGDSPKVLFADTDRGQYFFPNSRDNSSLRHMKIKNGDLPIGIQMGPSWSHSLQQADEHVQGSSSNIFNPAEKTYSSLHLQGYSNERDYQPATIHGYQMASYLRGISTNRNSYAASPRNLPSTSKFSTSYVSPLRYQDMYNHGHNNLGSMQTSAMQNSDLSRINTLQVASSYYEPSLMGSSERGVPPAYAKKYHSSPDISGIIALTRNLYLNEGKRNSPIGPPTSFGRTVGEQSRCLKPLLSGGTPLAFDELSTSNVHKEMFPFQPKLNSETRSLFAKQPFDELFGMFGKDQGGVDQGTAVTGASDHCVGDSTAVVRPSITAEETFPYAESEASILNSLRFCIMKILKLDGSDWLFRRNIGADEELIEQVAIAEKALHIESSGTGQTYIDELQYLSDLNSTSIMRSKDTDLVCPLSLPNCGDGCVWRAALVVSFGMWCIQRILDLLLVESRPELWGKYTYVLNRLQGIIEPAFFSPRQPLMPCTCLDISAKCLTKLNYLPKNGIPHAVEKFCRKSVTSATIVLDLIKNVEAAVSSRKGRTGTAAGDVAFPKGKENLLSVLKRYKRHLSNKP